MNASVLTFSCCQKSRPRPFPNLDTGTFGRGPDRVELVVSEADGDGVGARVVAARAAERHAGYRLRRARSSMSYTRAYRASGIDWMTDWRDITEAIPPDYCQFVGAQLLDHLASAVA